MSFERHGSPVGTEPKRLKLLTPRSAAQPDASRLGTADVLSSAADVRRVDLVQEAVAIRRCDSIGAYGQPVAVDVSITLGCGPLTVPEVTHVVVTLGPCFVGLITRRPNLIACLVSIAARL